MAKKKHKQKAANTAAARPVESLSGKLRADHSGDGKRQPWRELLAKPVLLAAWLCFAFTLFSVVATIRFRGDMSMGAMREPTSMIMWAAITLTLFASHWRHSRRPTPAAPADKPQS